MFSNEMGSDTVSARRRAGALKNDTGGVSRHAIVPLCEPPAYLNRCILMIANSGNFTSNPIGEKINYHTWDLH